MSCPACNRTPPRAGVVRTALFRALGQRWWAVESAGEASAEVVVALRREGVCERHLAWWATLARLQILSEARRHALVPGMTLVLNGEIPEDPHEPLPKGDRAAADIIVLGVQRWVSGSPLAAVVELDLEGGRARVTLQIAGSDPLLTMGVAYRQLARITPRQVIDGMRQRMAAG